MKESQPGTEDLNYKKRLEIHVRTLIKLAHGTILLHLKLPIRKFFVCIVCLDMVPRVVRKYIVALLKMPRPELKGIRSFVRVFAGFSLGFADGLELGGHAVGGRFAYGDEILEVRHAVFKLFALASMVV
jgi:hypothetical protein